MDDLLSQCQWPPLPARYEKALKECVAFLLDRYEVTSILACGTIIRGNPDPSSDLDVYVIHRGNYMQRVQRFFNGVPAEMFVNPFRQILRHFDTGIRERRPDSAHMIAHGFPVLTTGNEVEFLKGRALEILRQPAVLDQDGLTRERYRAATALEDAVDVADRDPETAQMILNEAVGLMLHHAISRSQSYLPRKKDLLDVLASSEPDIAALARRFYNTLDLRTRTEIACLLADLTILERGFFEWESMPIRTEE